MLKYVTYFKSGFWRVSFCSKHPPGLSCVVKCVNLKTAWKATSEIKGFEPMTS